MRRGIVGAALAAALCAPNVQAAPSAPVTVWVAERVSKSAKSVTVNANFGWDRRSGRVTYVAAMMVNGRPRPYDAMTFDAPVSDGPAVYHSATSYGCYAGSGCDVASGPGRTDFSVAAPEGYPQPDRIYLAVSAADSPDVRLVDSPGWKLTRTRLRVRYATSNRSTASGAHVVGAYVERFGHATLPGGARGSIAVATPPCRPLHRAGVVREGFGTATLAGGTERVTFDCRRDLHDLVGVAHRGTTWTFDGEVVGTAMGPTRLTVIDL